MRRRGSLHTRLDRLAPRTPVLRIVVIAPDSWPPAVVAAYDAAVLAGDRIRQASIITAQTGEQVTLEEGPGIRIIEIRERPDGPG